MRALDEAELLSLWESGQTRHPIDRALLLCAWARPDVAPERFAQLPLGVVNAGLLRMRAALFGAHVEVQLDCEHCGEHLELALDIGELLADLRLSVACEACGQPTQTSLDAGDLLWGDVQQHARGLLGQVHSLAQAYGWTEGEVFALSPVRRAAYLDLVRD